ncbi:MAG TPA: type II secretion system major pseudopilin GspG [Gemmatimonadaceae bacterium]|nr:type II secretion system major pseudopilin GspG [Gemmatimonadaceae bacterium]
MWCRTERSARGARRRGHLRSPGGFTLIELLVTIAIIATLAAIVAPSLFGNIGEARRNTAKSQIQILSLALDAYRLDNEGFPTSAQGLEALRTLPVADSPPNWKGPYLRQIVPLDPWGRPYVYVSPGVANPNAYDLYTLGKDGRPGGDGEDADMTSWNGPVHQ